MNELTEKEKEVKYGESCPVCKTSWTKTPRVVTSDKWWHCEKCKKKAITIFKQEANKNQVNPIDLDSWGYGRGFF